MRVMTIDLLKIVSIFLVILSHVSLFFISKDSDNVLLYFFRQSGQLGVAVFFMCSGYFLLNNNKPDQANYIFEKIKKISLVLLFWLFFYYLYDKFIIGRFTDVEKVNIFNFFNISKTTSEASHLWFIFSIIALYILTPLLRDSFRESNKSNILKVLIAILIISNLTLVNAITQRFFSFSLIPFNILLPFQSEGLLSFLIGGYLGLNKNLLLACDKRKFLLIILFIMSFFALSIISSKVGMTFFYGKFYNVLLQISAFCLFVLVFNLPLDRLPSLVVDISNNILGIYLVHNIFVVEIHSGFIHKFLLRFIPGVNQYFYIILYTLLSFMLSYLLCVLIRQSKLASKLITL